MSAEMQMGVLLVDRLWQLDGAVRGMDPAAERQLFPVRPVKILKDYLANWAQADFTD